MEKIIKNIVHELINDGLQYEIHQEDEGIYIDINYKQMKEMLKNRGREGLMAWYIMDGMDIDQMIMEIVKESRWG